MKRIDFRTLTLKDFGSSKTVRSASIGTSEFTSRIWPTSSSSSERPAPVSSHTLLAPISAFNAFSAACCAEGGIVAGMAVDLCWRSKITCIDSDVLASFRLARAECVHVSMAAQGAGQKKRDLSKPIAAAVGATLTALTSKEPTRFMNPPSSYTRPVTPFDVIKTRLQTQLTPQVSAARSPQSRGPLLFPKPPRDACCRPSGGKCARLVHCFAFSGTIPATQWIQLSSPPQVVCLWDGQIYRNRQVNGFRDAAWQIWKAESFAGLWKGVGTTL